MCSYIAVYWGFITTKAQVPSNVAKYVPTCTLLFIQFESVVCKCMPMWFHDKARWVASHPIHPPWISPCTHKSSYGLSNTCNWKGYKTPFRTSDYCCSLTAIWLVTQFQFASCKLYTTILNKSWKLANRQWWPYIKSSLTEL